MLLISCDPVSSWRCASQSRLLSVSFLVWGRPGSPVPSPDCLSPGLAPLSSRPTPRFLSWLPPDGVPPSSRWPWQDAWSEQNSMWDVASFSSSSWCCVWLRLSWSLELCRGLFLSGMGWNLLFAPVSLKFHDIPRCGCFSCFTLGKLWIKSSLISFPLTFLSL